ncbi:MAG TPA: radical SAM protein [Candidatus Deferrimicrobium sp.]|nr:radical SAM protein [Candidatus Deferrimicrobium sp.]
MNRSQKEISNYYPFEIDGETFLFISNTVSLYKVSRKVFDAATKGNREDMAALFPSRDNAPKEERLEEHEDRANRDPEFKEMYLQIIHDCNLNCGYCYAGGGTFGGEAARMDIATAEKAADFFIENLNPTAIGDFGFDGGEPFLNWDIIEHMVPYAREKAAKLHKKLSFHIGTNGTLFTPRTNAFIKENEISLGVSIDGEKHTHDAHRTSRDNRGSYDRVIRNIKSLLEISQNHDMQARATITRTDLKCLEIAKHLRQLGFRHIYLEPVAGSREPWLFSAADLQMIKQEFSRLALFYRDELLAGRFFIFRNFFIFLKRLHLKKRAIYRCGVGRSSLAFTPRGDIFPCYKFSGIPQYRMGSVHGEPIAVNIKREFQQNHVDRRPGCRDCWAKYLCGGGCAYLSFCKKNDMNMNDPQDCELSRHLATLSLQIYAAVQMKKPKLWDAFFQVEKKPNP